MAPSTANEMTNKSTKRSRSRQLTETAILDAVGRIFARDGYAHLGINAIAREADVDKVLIYRYFGGLPQLLQAFGSHGGFWPSVDELFKSANIETLPFDMRLQLFIDSIIDALRSRPLTLEILAMEMDSPNELTDILNTTLEQWGKEVATRLSAGYTGDIARLNIIMTTLFAGIQYLMLRTRTTEVFSGIPIREDKGWDSIKQSLAWLCTRMVEEDVIEQPSKKLSK